LTRTAWLLPRAQKSLAFCTQRAPQPKRLAGRFCCTNLLTVRCCGPASVPAPTRTRLKPLNRLRATARGATPANWKANFFLSCWFIRIWQVN